MNTSLPVVGIDVSKATLDVHWGSQKGKRWHARFPNTTDGFAEVHAWILSHQVQHAHCCLEATGSYSDGIATFCHAQGHLVSMLAPDKMLAFRKSEGILSKTDAIDARLIALYGEQKHPRPWHPVDAAAQQLKRDLDRLDELQAMRQQERNRLENLRLDEVARQEIQAHITWLQEQEDRWSQILQTRFEEASRPETGSEEMTSHPPLGTGKKRKGQTSQRNTTPLEMGPIDAMMQVVGVGRLSALRMYAVFSTLQYDLSADQIASYFGVVPHTHESGTSVNGKPRRRGGNRQARSWLYMSALCSKVHDPDMAQWANELEGRGLCKKAVTVAVIHKLVRILFHLYKHPTAYDATKAFPTHVQRQGIEAA